MSDVAIRAEGLSKRYRIVRALGGNRHGTIREALSAAMLKPLRRASGILGSSSSGPGSRQEIWALRDVSLDIKVGEVVGIIGRNGAGKSTFLKILSRITEPTAGHGEIWGRVGSLLEVGAGFHPELSGRENVYLNGSILGMRRAEISRKFDEIVAFAELDEFIDTPVKRYSSGMYMRLAFAVAAHLEPEILLVDEVLAVGDVRFQRKCLGKMQTVGRDGRTVLFVSHNMQAIARLCQRAVLFADGRLVADGPVRQVLSRYLNAEGPTTASREWDDPAAMPGDAVIRLCAVRVRSDNRAVVDDVDVRQPVGLEMEYQVLQAGRILMPSFDLYNEEGVKVIEVVDLDPAWRQRPRPSGRYVTTAWIPANLLAEGQHFLEVGVTSLHPTVSHVSLRDVVTFRVIDAADGSSTRGDWGGTFTGAVRPLLRWTTESIPDQERAAITATER